LKIILVEYILPTDDTFQTFQSN